MIFCSLPCRVLFEGLLLVPWSIEFAAGGANLQKYIELMTEHSSADCRYWQYKCTPSGITQGFTIAWAAVFMLHAAQFYYFSVRTRYQLRARPFPEFRASNVLLQLQARLLPHLLVHISLRWTVQASVDLSILILSKAVCGGWL